METKKTKKRTMNRYPKALVEGAIAGNRDDFSKLLECCIKDIFYFATLHADRQDAEDIVQEVAILLQRKIHTLTDPDNFVRWLSVVVRNTSASYARKHHKFGDNVELEECMERTEYADLFTTERAEFLPERYVEDAELCEIVMDEIGQLPTRQQICLSYHYLHDFKRADIVAATDFNPAQVANALHKGRQTLKKRLEKRLGETLVFSYVPAGTLPAMARVFQMMQDAVVSKECIEQLYIVCMERLGMVEVMPVKGTSNVLKYCVGAACTVVTVGVLGVAFWYGNETPMPEEIAPSPIVSQEEQEEGPFAPDVEEEEEPEAEPLQEEREIRTVADMIGDTEAYVLEGFIDHVSNSEDWRIFIEGIGAEEYDRSTGYEYVYIMYILEKQNKRLLLAEHDPGDGNIRVLYLFGDRDEPVEVMARIVLRF